jgi:hypothetical protein
MKLTSVPSAQQGDACAELLAPVHVQHMAQASPTVLDLVQVVGIYQEAVALVVAQRRRLGIEGRGVAAAGGAIPARRGAGAALHAPVHHAVMAEASSPASIASRTS